MSDAAASAAAAATITVGPKAEGSTYKEAPKHTSKSAVARLTDDELLVKHYPRYFYDKSEKIFPVDLNK